MIPLQKRQVSKFLETCSIFLELKTLCNCLLFPDRPADPSKNQKQGNIDGVSQYC